MPGKDLGSRRAGRQKKQGSHHDGAAAESASAKRMYKKSAFKQRLVADFVG